MTEISTWLIRPTPITWPDGLLFWLTFFLVVIPEIRLTLRSQAGIPKTESRDSGTFRLLVLGQYGTLACGFALSFSSILHFPASILQPLFWVGLVLMALGTSIRRHCWAMLGEYFTGDIRVAKDQRIIENGAYRWLRHPSYLGGLMILFGTGLCFGNTLGLATLLCGNFYFYKRRIEAEEAALTKHFGKDYEAFAKNRRKFIPFIY